MMNPPLCGAMALVPVFGPSLRLPKIALLLIICEGPRHFELTDSPQYSALADSGYSFEIHFVGSMNLISFTTRL